MRTFGEPASLARTGMVSTWAVFSMHHAYEAGLAHAAGPISVVIFSTLVLVASLAALDRYEQRGSAASFRVLTAAVLAWWVAATGLIEGFYGHTLKDILYFAFGVPPSKLPRSTLGLRYDLPGNVFGEVTGVLPFLFGILIARAWWRLANQRRSVAAPGDRREPSRAR